MDNQELLQAIGQMIEPLNSRLDTLQAGQEALQREVLEMKLIQENITNKNIQLLMEGMTGVNEKFQRLDELEEKVEDIQITVSVLKALTVKK